MMHTKYWKPSLVSLVVFGMLALLVGVAFAQIGYTSDGSPHVDAVINFQGLPAGTVVSSLSSGNGISGDPVVGQVAVLGFNPAFGSGTNAAMIFNSTCPPGKVPADCSGGDRDLFKPALGKILIISEDLDSTDPDDAAITGVYFDFDFSGFGMGRVAVDSLDVIDVDEPQQLTNARVDLYSGGLGGTLLGSVPIPNTGNNGVGTINIGISGVDYMRVMLNGSGGIDNLRLRPEIEVIYLSNVDRDDDGRSSLYRVEIDETNGVANLYLLPNGRINYNHVDVIAVNPTGTRLFFVDDGLQPKKSWKSTLGHYDFATQTVTEIGPITWNGINYLRVDQAAFSQDGTLYITSSEYDNLLTVNKTNAVATEVGKIVNQATGATLDVLGSDITFATDGSLYLWVNVGRNGAPYGLYQLALPAVNGQVLATFIGGGTDFHTHRGTALRYNGAGPLVGSTEENELHVMDRQTSLDVIPPMPLYKNGKPFNAGSGDMSIGPFAP